MSIQSEEAELTAGPPLPDRISRLYELANNLWWSWHEDARQVFRSLDYPLWRTTGHNPVRQLRNVSWEQLESVAKDVSFLELYDSVLAQFDADMTGEGKWCGSANPGKVPGTIAYFSPEFAIHSSLPIYAGGLGILAGDILKEASDLGLPMVGIGFMYPQGYFHQHISPEGWQQEVYTELNFDEAPISSCPWPERCGPLVPIELGERTLHLAVWLVKVGRVNLYLLDTNVEENRPQDRSLSARLYTADPESRIQQLIALGMGGVKALRALGIQPVVWHTNEDHTAFMILERLLEDVQNGSAFSRAIKNVRAGTVFTTHTPVPTGHNIFSVGLIDRYFQHVWKALKIDRSTFIKLGQYQGLDPSRFSMSAFALRLSGQANAVSKLHGEVTRKMWHALWPAKSEENVPISHVTNGVHTPTWQAPEIVTLCQKYMGKTPSGGEDDARLWECIADVPDEEFWQVHELLKTRLIRTIHDRAQQRWVEDAVPTQQVISMGTLLDPYPLTIVFSRRFSEYKRPGLILTDIERLKGIINNPARPVQVIFTGKSHPADWASKSLLNKVYQSTLERTLQGRVAFIEDYDMHLARDLARGADVWLNNPRRLQEASGTSGMKAAMNGVINLSVPDGWWAEGYDGSNGWAIGSAEPLPPVEEDRADAEALYRLLEEVVVPLYYDRDVKGIPHRWVQMAKESIRTISPQFSACRMLKEYTERMYLPATRLAAGE